MEKIIYDSLCEIFEDEFDRECYFEDKFQNNQDGKTYIITGNVGLWDGVRENVHHPNFFDSIAEAIITANDGFDGDITVSEGKYGKLFIDISHHDGSNHLEVRELTNLGEEMMCNYASVQEVINRKGATKNVKFCSRYM